MSVCHCFIALILMFLCSHLSVVSCSVILYITASADEHNCPTKPCVTLPQLAANITNYSSDNMSIVFLQGKHHLDRKLQFVNISTVSITFAAHSHSNSISENASIVCSESASFEFNHIDKVSISNLNFTGCENKMQSASILMIEQSSFHGKHYSGSAVELVESMAFISRSNFISNLNGNYLGPIEILRLKVNSSIVFAKAGGALVATQSEVNVIDSVFENNSAVVGGSIFSWRNSNVTIVNSTFYYNSASSHDIHVESYGGAVYFESDDNNSNLVPYGSYMMIYSTSFIENKAHYGGALAIVAGYISVKSSYFRRNIAVYGGSLMTIITTIVTDNSEFESNIAAAGGAAVAYDYTAFSISNSVFTLNTAQNIGGAIAAEKASCKIFNSDFSNNTAERGGALIVRNSKLLNVNMSRFNHNYVLGSNGVGGVIRTIQSKVMIYHSQFYKNGAEDEGGVMSSLTGSQIGIEDCQFVNNYAQSAAGVLLLQNYSSAAILGSNFENNSAGLVAGVVGLAIRSSLTISRSHFYSNQAPSGSGVLQAQIWSITMIFNSVFHNTTSGVISSCCFSTTVIESSIFVNNEAYLEAIIAGYNFTTFNIHGSHFENSIGHKNENVSTGFIACIMTFMYSHAYIFDSNFTRNSAQGSVGLIRAYTASNLTLKHVQASNNTAYMGGALALEAKSTASIYKSSFVGNNARYLGGAIYVFDCESAFIYDSIFSENYAEKGVIFLDLSHTVHMADIIVSHNHGSLFLYSSIVQFTGEVFITDNTNPRSDNSEAGAITAFQSEIMVDNGTFCLTQNNAESGGGIHATDSIIFILNATATISNNMAQNNGGGLYLYQGELICKNNCTLRITNNIASKKGGGIYAISSSTKVYFGRNWRYNYARAMVYINDNVAEKGGGICLERNTNLYILKFDDSDKRNAFLGYGFHFMANTADYGGAVYIADETNVETCDSNYHYANNANSSECFIQVISLDMSLINIFDINSISFQQNFAYKSGSTIFGGLLDRCIPSHFAEIYKMLNFTLPNNRIIDGATYLQYISNIKPDSISSQPVRLCFCHNGQQNCNYQHPSIKVKKGEAFTITLIAVDQVNHTVPNTSIHSNLLSSESSLGEGQLQMTNEYCTNLTFSITSILVHEQVTMYPEGPCKDALMSRSVIDVQFLKCTCPTGFQENADYSGNCVCECDTKIFPEYVSACDSKTETVVRKPKCWIGYINDTKNSSGYLTYSYCPFDYCLPSSAELNLNVANGPDAQCAHNRRRLLCGACKNGLSLSLGSSHCLSCTNWSSNFIIILTTTFLVGIAMVAIILVIKLTVASGTLSGIIFYANIINASSSTFLPFASPNIITVAITWLNLELGIDVCLFNGMDAYWKAWIELVFPAYLIFLVVLVIYMCKYFNKFARLIGGKNPVAALATLILLSYTKILRTIITSLSFAILYYPNHSREFVWLPDATVKYLRGKHIALFLAAVLILLAGTFYTLLLLTWQWIHGSKYRILKWIDRPKFDHFIEAYNAPYTSEHRYWTGLLLLVRVILYMVVSINVSNDPAINLLAIGVVVSVLLLLKVCLKVYKNKWHDYLEIACFFNIILLSLASLYTLESELKNQIFIAYISGSVILALLVVIFIYHTYKEIVLKLKNKLCRRASTHSSHQIVQPYASSALDINLTASVAPTSSVIDAPTSQEHPFTDMLVIGIVQQKEKCEDHDLSQDSESDVDQQQPLLPK